MTELAARVLPGTTALLAVHHRELPQLDGLCGAFWARCALLAFGLDAPDQGAVAARAGITVLAARTETPRPPGEPAQSEGAFALPVASSAASAGAAPSGVARAIEELAGDRLGVVPVSGHLEASRVRGLLDRLAGSAEDVICLANVATSALWGSHPAPDVVLGYLLTGDPGAGPPAEWDVGHFVALAGLAAGPAGTVVLVADSYRSLGHDGLHLQPVERLAEAVGPRSATGTGRGLLVVTPAGAERHVRRAVAEEGLHDRLWDNGSTDLRPGAREDGTAGAFDP